MPLFTPPSGTVAANSSTAATAGTAGSFSRGDHSHPRYIWNAGDNGFLAMNADPAVVVNNQAMSAAGTLQVSKINVPAAITVTNIVIYITIAGAVLTSGQNFGALYNSSKTLLAQTVDQSTNFASTGVISMALSSPQAIAAGTYYVAFWYNGTTSPTIRCGLNSASVNMGLTGNNSRFGTADTGKTTTAPSTMGTITASGPSWWVALS